MESRSALREIPVLRAGVEYESLDTAEVRDVRTGEVVARVHQANAGIVRRDCADARGGIRRSVPVARLLICNTAESSSRGSRAA
jgi:hypothetical protein